VSTGIFTILNSVQSNMSLTLLQLNKESNLHDITLDEKYSDYKGTYEFTQDYDPINKVVDFKLSREISTLDYMNLANSSDFLFSYKTYSESKPDEAFFNNIRDSIVKQFEKYLFSYRREVLLKKSQASKVVQDYSYVESRGYSDSLFNFNVINNDNSRVSSIKVYDGESLSTDFDVYDAISSRKKYDK
jgi:hypothetical protein